MMQGFALQGTGLDAWAADAPLAALSAGVPLAGVAAALAFWGNARILRAFCVAVAVTSLVAVSLVAGRFAATPLGLLPAAILPATAAAALLGQPAHRSHRLWWLETLVCLGLALGSLSGADVWQHACKAALVLLVIYLLVRERSSFAPVAWWGVGALIVCLAGLLLARSADERLAPWAALAACVPLLPLVPFHAGYAASLTRLPGSTAGFLAVAMPLLGLHSAVTLLGDMPGELWNGIGWLALASAAWGGVRALVRADFRGMVAFGSVSLLSLAWWFAAGTSGPTLPAATVYVVGVALAAGGLLAAWQVVRSRYGDAIDPRGVSNLVKGMPTFAALAYILGLAAMGLPPFGPFTGFVNQAIELPLAAWGGLGIVLVVWLVASWYVIGMIHRVLFGPDRPALAQTDLVPQEVLSLATYVVLLAVVGLLPTGLLARPEPSATTIVMDAGLEEVRR
jgi:NADH-quinone oxidoreductase subunit M